MPPKRAPRDSVVTSDMEDSQSTSSGLSARKRRRLNNASQLDLCQEFYDRLRSARNNEGMQITDPFMRLPSKRSFPEYFEAIKEPIDLCRVLSKIKDAEYSTSSGLSEMVCDINLVISNARSFYAASTEEFEMACDLADALEREHKTLMQQAATAGTSGNASVAAGDRQAESITSTGSDSERRLKREMKCEDKGDDDYDDGLSLAPSEGVSEASTSLTTGSQSDNPLELFFAAVASHTKKDGNAIAPTFTFLPSKATYPAYYAVIKEPMDLRMIAQRVLQNGYSGVDDLERDFTLMVRNAKMFNEPRSLVYQDAICLGRVVKAQRFESKHTARGSKKERRA